MRCEVTHNVKVLKKKVCLSAYCFDFWGDLMFVGQLIFPAISSHDKRMGDRFTTESQHNGKTMGFECQ